MKKLMSLLFVFALSLTGIYAPSASAGNSNAALQKEVTEDSQTGVALIFHTIKEDKYVYERPGDLSVQEVLKPGQNMRVDEVVFKIETNRGSRWVSYSNYTDEYTEMFSLPKRFNATTGKLYLDKRTKTWTNLLNNHPEKDVWTIDPQTVTVTQVWYQIDMPTGGKWIGYNI